MIENGMVIDGAACNWGYGWDDEPDPDIMDRYYDDMCDAMRDDD